MADKMNCTLFELYNQPDKELADIIRSVIVEFQKQQKHGVEGIIGYTCTADEAVILVTIQKKMIDPERRR